MNRPEFEYIDIEDITIPAGMRPINEEALVSLVASIGRIGVQNPPTVIIDEESDPCTVTLIAGRHRVEACRRLGLTTIVCEVFSGSDVEARLWEIAENLHRAELTVLERAAHVAEWIRLNPKSQNEIGAVANELGIERNEAYRAVQIDKLSDEAKKTAVATGMDDHQTVLLKAAKEPAAKQSKIIIDEASERKSRNRALVLEEKRRASEEWGDWILRHADQGEMPAIFDMILSASPRATVNHIKGELA